MRACMSVCSRTSACVCVCAVRVCLCTQALVFAVGMLQHETAEVLKEERSHDDL